MRCSTLSCLALITACSVKASTQAPESAPPPVAAEPEANEVPEDAAKNIQTAIESTVLIATRWGHGTGVFLDDEGLILTNYHVIASGQTEDFVFGAEVTTASLGEDGTVSVDKSYQATAVKVDEDLDLALLRIEGADRKFPFVKLEESSPQPGGSVSAIGNAGVGFGWAVKHCSINAIGTMDSFASAIFAMQQKHRTDEELAKLKAEVDEVAKEKGKQIQTDCNVLPGDSGGPLLSEDTGRLVGLNASIRPATAGFATLGSAAFHIHVDEIRAFSKKVPERATPELPDPWKVAGKHGRFIDFNADGEIDTLRFEGLCEGMLRCSASLTDLDQSTFHGVKDLPSVDDIYESRKFDAEMAVLRIGRLPRDPKQQLPVSDLVVLANTDGKRGYDRVLVYDGETYKTRGYRKAGKALDREPKLDGYKLEALPELFTNKRLKARADVFLASITGQRGDGRNPDKTRALEANFSDGSGDGKYDTLEIRTRVDSRILVDLDQDQLQKVSNRVTRAVKKKLSSGEGSEDSHEELVDKRVLTKLRRGKLHGEVLAIMGAPVRVYYDTDRSGTYDLLLEGDSVERGIAVVALNLDPSGKSTPAPEHVGRKLLRPGLIKDPEQAKRLVEIFTHKFVGAPRAELDDAKTSFPFFDPERTVAAMEIEGTKRALVSVLDRESINVLADLDRSSFKGKRSKGKTVDAVRNGKFDAEFIYRQSGNLAWAFYDGNNDGRFERIYISQPGNFLVVGSAFKVDKAGNVTLDSDSKGGKMLAPERFKSKSSRAVFEKTVIRSVQGQR